MNEEIFYIINIHGKEYFDFMSVCNLSKKQKMVDPKTMKEAGFRVYAKVVNCYFLYRDGKLDRPYDIAFQKTNAIMAQHLTKNKSEAIKILINHKRLLLNIIFGAYR